MQALLLLQLFRCSVPGDHLVLHSHVDFQLCAEFVFVGQQGLLIRSQDLLALDVGNLLVELGQDLLRSRQFIGLIQLSPECCLLLTQRAKQANGRFLLVLLGLARCLLEPVANSGLGGRDVLGVKFNTGRIGCANLVQLLTVVAQGLVHLLRIGRTLVADLRDAAFSGESIFKRLCLTHLRLGQTILSANAALNDGDLLFGLGNKCCKACARGSTPRACGLPVTFQIAAGLRECSAVSAGGTNACKCCASGFDLAFNATPCTLKDTCVVNDLALASFHRVSKRIERSGGRFLRAALRLQCCDVVVNLGGQEVVLLVQFHERVNGFFPKIREVTHQLFDAAPGHFGSSDHPSQGDGQVVATDSACLGQGHGSVPGIAILACDLANLIGQLSNACGRKARSATGRVDSIEVSVGLLRALVVGQSQAAHGSGSKGVGVDQRGDTGGQATQRRHDTTEHVLQLATLLEQDCQRGLATLERDHDVGKLCRHLAQRRSGLLGAHAVGVERSGPIALGPSGFTGSFGGLLFSDSGSFGCNLLFPQAGDVGGRLFRDPHLGRTQFKVLGSAAASGLRLTLKRGQEALGRGIQLLVCTLHLFGDVFHRTADTLGSVGGGLLETLDSFDGLGHPCLKLGGIDTNLDNGTTYCICHDSPLLCGLATHLALQGTCTFGTTRGVVVAAGQKGIVQFDNGIQFPLHRNDAAQPEVCLNVRPRQCVNGHPSLPFGVQVAEPLPDMGGAKRDLRESLQFRGDHPGLGFDLQQRAESGLARLVGL